MRNSSGNNFLKALIRADGSHHLGIGHITRCLAFAQGLEQRGIKSVFVLRDYDEGLIGLIQRRGFEVKSIPEKSSLKEDASYTAELALKHKVNFIVVDLSHTYNLRDISGFIAFFNILRATKKFMIAIDDLKKTDFPVEMQIIPYYGAEKRGYVSPDGTKLLLGPAYFISGPHFVRASRVKRTIREKADHILVTMGGSDPHNATIKIARSLARLKNPELKVKIVIGKCFNIFVKDAVSEILQGFRGNYELCAENEDLDELMLWSDLAITAGGLTKYETAITGTPNIIVSQYELEAKRMQEFEEAGTTVHLGRFDMISEKDIAKEIEDLSDDLKKRTEMSKRGKQLIDGEGVNRIIREMPEELLI